MPDDKFSFRWGVPWLDKDFMQIPASFFRGYMRAGVTRSEFLFVLHLASWKYESRKGESRPSLARIAGEMGINRRTAQRLRVSLEEKGLLGVYYQRGQPSVYSFEGLATALMAEERGGDTQTTLDTHTAPPATPTPPPPATPTPPEEQEDKKKNQQQEEPGVVPLSREQENAKIALESVGVNEHAIGGLLQRYGTDRILEVVAAVEDAGDIRNSAAWVVRALERGYSLPVTEVGADYRKRLRTSVDRCAYHRNPQIGMCPGEDPEREDWAGCEVCDRGGKETAPVEKQQEILF